MHSEKTSFTDQVQPLMLKDGCVLEVFSARVYTVKPAYKNLSFSKLG